MSENEENANSILSELSRDMDAHQIQSVAECIGAAITDAFDAFLSDKTDEEKQEALRDVVVSRSKEILDIFRPEFFIEL